MKKSFLDWWCGQPWLHATYFLGIVMLNVLIINWNTWPVPQKLMGLLTVLLPLHVFEELTWPNGFQFMMNKLIQKSDSPLAYPENRLTDMITNFGAELMFIALTFITPLLGNKGVVFVIFFGIGETLVHTVFSFVTLKHYQPMGKKTLYTPGLFTTWCSLLEVAVYGLYWLIKSGSFVKTDLWGLALVAFLIIFMIRLPFIISNKIKSTKYAYADMRYFAKYEK
ncbi:MAG: HXXEE domain-containing protein [Oscillospiraceae bacterium]|nr:HXXEE domain-containing protein [Oscillospiraceae bacterium]